MGNGTGMWMTSCPEAMGWDFGDFWKKQLVEIYHWIKRIDFWAWARPVQFGTTECAMRYWVRWNSQHSKNCMSLSLSLSPRVEKTKSKKKVNKRFVPEQRESSVFRDSYACEHFTYLYICSRKKLEFLFGA